KDASSPQKVFARAQLLAQDDPKAALKLIEPMSLDKFPAPMQDDVSLLKAQLFLSFGRTQDARKCADSMNLDNPDRKEIRPYAAGVVAEAWGRTGKSKEALALLDTVEIPKKNGEQIAIQLRIARVFAKFASGQRGPARTELTSLADEDPNYLGKFLAPQFRVHPELQKLARSVLEAHPSARQMAKKQARAQKR
ncbi:MAG: tetratricopeptide repeat protein, partial [Myxococcales bacterium]|nr:tetratricopeptide repeat protein [Myxococcales bacterium]